MVKLRRIYRIFLLFSYESLLFVFGSKYIWSRRRTAPCTELSCQYHNSNCAFLNPWVIRILEKNNQNLFIDKCYGCATVKKTVYLQNRFQNMRMVVCWVLFFFSSFCVRQKRPVFTRTFWKNTLLMGVSYHAYRYGSVCINYNVYKEYPPPPRGLPRYKRV